MWLNACRQFKLMMHNCYDQQPTFDWCGKVTVYFLSVGHDCEISSRFLIFRLSLMIHLPWDRWPSNGWISGPGDGASASENLSFAFMCMSNYTDWWCISSETTCWIFNSSPSSRIKPAHGIADQTSWLCITIQPSGLQQLDYYVTHLDRCGYESCSAKSMPDFRLYWLDSFYASSFIWLSSLVSSFAIWLLGSIFNLICECHVNVM